MYSVDLKELINEYSLKILTSNSIEGKVISHPEINRPALQFSGFFDYFSSERLQVIGLVEHAFLDTLTSRQRTEVFEKFCSYPIPAIVICRDLEVHSELIEQANKNNIDILQTHYPTSDFCSEVIRWLKVQLAPRITMHGVLLDIYGEGVLITGESGIGKSEIALELIKRGHRLVADDAVEIKKVSENTLVGSCPELIRHFIEVRGIGIINAKQMFGVQSVKDTQSIDLIIKLESWNKDTHYDRLGLSEEHIEILGNKVVCQTIPVSPGRNIALICESASVNRREKKMGYNAAQILNDRINNA